MNKDLSSSPKPIKLTRVITTVFVLIATTCLCILGIYEKQNLIVIMACFAMAAVYLYASIKNIYEYISYKKSTKTKK